MATGEQFYNCKEDVMIIKEEGEGGGGTNLLQEQTVASALYTTPLLLTSLCPELSWSNQGQWTARSGHVVSYYWALYPNTSVFMNFVSNKKRWE